MPLDQRDSRWRLLCCPTAGVPARVMRGTAPRHAQRVVAVVAVILVQPARQRGHVELAADVERARRRASRASISASSPRSSRCVDVDAVAARAPAVALELEHELARAHGRMNRVDEPAEHARVRRAPTRDARRARARSPNAPTAPARPTMRRRPPSPAATRRASCVIPPSRNLRCVRARIRIPQPKQSHNVDGGTRSAEGIVTTMGDSLAGKRSQRGGTLVLDGGTGTELRRRGMPLDADVWSALALADALRSAARDPRRTTSQPAPTSSRRTRSRRRASCSRPPASAQNSRPINARAVAAAREARDASGRDVGDRGLDLVPAAALRRARLSRRARRERRVPRARRDARRGRRRSLMRSR